MKVTENEEPDRYGEYPECWVTGSDANPQKISDWLQRHAQGYKFAMVFDTTKDEYEPPEYRTPVYFLDTLFNEVCEYMGRDSVLNCLTRMGWINSPSDKEEEPDHAV